MRCETQINVIPISFFDKLFGNLCVVSQMKIGFLFKKSCLFDLIFNVIVEHDC